MRSMRQAFGETLVNLANSRNDFVVLDADVAGGTGLASFREKFPDRFIQCGIAEQNMFSMAAGIAASGLIPIATCYAFAALRAMEQIRNSIAYPRFPVKIVVSHLGLDVGPDGATHQAVEDIAVMRSIPGLMVASPADPLELAAILPLILDSPNPVYLRTGRSPLPDIFREGQSFEPFKAPQIGDGTDAAILAVGVMVSRAVKAIKLLEEHNIKARVLDMSWIKPLDTEAIVRAAQECGLIVSCEDHNQLGGLGAAVAEVLAKTYPVPMEFVGIDDCYGQSGDPADLARLYHLTAEDIANAVMRGLPRKRGRA